MKKRVLLSISSAALAIAFALPTGAAQDAKVMTIAPPMSATMVAANAAKKAEAAKPAAQAKKAKAAKKVKAKAKADADAKKVNKKGKAGAVKTKPA